MASIRKRGNSYLIVVSTGYDYQGNRRKSQQKTVKPPDNLTPKQQEKWLNEQAMEQSYLTHNPAWRTYKPQGQKKKKIIADEETVQKILSALEQESIKYEVYFKIIIATGMRRGECCGIQWSDINFKENSIHIQRNVVKVGGEKVFTKEPKTKSGNSYVYFSDTLASLLGHAQVSTTLDIYTHAFDKNRKKAAEELQKGLGV
ncbi:MAG: site-specific integrase [Hydrogenoanaerobacterium sp.]